MTKPEKVIGSKGDRFDLQVPKLILETLAIKNAIKKPKETFFGIRMNKENRYQ